MYVCDMCIWDASSMFFLAHDVPLGLLANPWAKFSLATGVPSWVFSRWGHAPQPCTRGQHLGLHATFSICSVTPLDCDVFVGTHMQYYLSWLAHVM